MTGYVRDCIIVLNKYKFKESSAIIKSFGKDYGAQSLIAYGLFKPKNIYLSSMEIFSINEIIFFYKQGNNLQRIKESKLLFYPDKIIGNMEKIKYTGKVLSIIKQQKYLTETIPCLFVLTANTLKQMNDSDNTYKVYIRFLLNYLIIEGIVNFNTSRGIRIKKLVIEFFKYNSKTAFRELTNILEIAIKEFNENI